jgi:class 3 adenylate cyclase
VNAASRLEGATKEMRCVVAAGEQTIRAAGPGIRTGKVQTLSVKGRAEPIRAHEVLGIDDS